MLPQERYDQIMQLLSNRNVVKIEEMVDTFKISVETVRRDLNYLEKEGRLKKVYGGATILSSAISEPSSTERLTQNHSEKVAIGKKCSEFINDGDSILLEIGTTTLEVARHLKEKKNLTVITNSVYVVNELIDTDFDLYVIGGKIRHEEKAISGAVSMFELDHFNIGKAIIGAGAITPKNGISDYNIEEALIRKKIIERSKEIIIVADNSKFGFDSLVNVCPLTDIHLIITGKELAPDLSKEFGELNTKLVLAD